MRAALSFALLLGLAASAHAAPPLKLVGDDWCPYNCDPQKPRPGYLVDMLRAILGRDYDVQYRLEPWTRAVKLVDSGSAQLLLATTPATTPQLMLSEPVGIDRSCFYVRAGNPWRYQKPDDLAKVKLGVIQDYNYDGDGPVDRLIAGYRQSKDPRLELAYGEHALSSNFRKLAAGRSEVVIENENVARHTLGELGLAESVRQAGCISHYAGILHVASSRRVKGAEALMRRINSGMSELRESGRLEALLKPYGIADWQGTKK